MSNNTMGNPPNKSRKNFSHSIERFLLKLGLKMRAKLLIILLTVIVVPILVLTIIAWQQFTSLGSSLRDVSVGDSSKSLNDIATENIERITTDTAGRIADFLYARDADIRLLSQFTPDEATFSAFSRSKTKQIIKAGDWELSADQLSWIPVIPQKYYDTGVTSTNDENKQMDAFHYRKPELFEYTDVPIYDEITFVDLDGNETIKYVNPSSTKINYPLSGELRNISDRSNTYVRAESYFAELKKLQAGDIYVSDVIGAYVPSNYIGMYTPEVIDKADDKLSYDIVYSPENQAYAGKENPNGKRFEGIIRWATPVTDDSGAITGYLTFAVNHDLIMEFVDHITPMNERYTELPSAFEGNYAFIWDYKCRNISHPRHHSIVGYNPETGDPQVPWLETSIYEGWQASGVASWMEYVSSVTPFDSQSREKKPAADLTRLGLVGLDGRYLNNAPQCTGWMDLTQNGGSGSFFILWSGLYKLTTAGAIPYYTGQYAPSEENGMSRRGFGFVTIGAGLDDFTRPAKDTEAKLDMAINTSLTNTTLQFVLITAIIVILSVLIAVLMSSYLTNSITTLINGISRFTRGERQFRFNAEVKDEFGTLADSFDDMADSVVDSVKNPLSITDLDLNIVYMNESGLEFNEKALSEVVGTSYSEKSIYPTGSPYCPITALKEDRDAEILYTNKDRYIKGKADYIYDKSGEKIGYIVVTTDVTDMVLERVKIEEQRILLDRIFSASPDLIWYMSANGTYLAVNPRFASITGRAVEDFAGKTAKEILPHHMSGSFIKNDNKAFKSDFPIYSEERILFDDGHEEILDSVRTPIYDPSGPLIGILGFARNVNTRIEIEHDLRTTQQELEQAVRAANLANEHKGEFLARMSHEIRTPMNAIIGLTNIVQRRLADSYKDDEGIDEVKGHLRQIEVSSQHLLGLLNDILDISKIEAGKIELSDEVMDLPKLVNTVAGIIKPRCDEKNITFDVKLSEFAPFTFLADSLRLRQVLINLLGNAVKFTPELGKVEFRVDRINRSDDETCVKFSVRDTGIGIAPEAIEAIFEPFEQGNGKITRQFGGTGLGLAISRKIIQLFGGDITVTSTHGEGSEFSFSIWFKETDEEIPEIEEIIRDASGKFKGKRALLVDDVEINRMVFMSLLEETGMDIDEAEDGSVALNMFRSSEERQYDIIFMDVQMPIMDGYEATQQIRALPRADARDVPIITLTANAFKEDIDKAIKSGMNAHISKPVEMDKLVEVLFRYLRES